MWDNIWFTSDLHLYHKRIMEFCPTTRFGDDVDHMSEIILENILSTVPKGADLFNLGDVSFGESEKTRKALKRIAHHCNHHLIRGNHDKGMTANRDLFVDVRDYREISVGTGKHKKDIIMFHFPIGEHNKNHYGSWHLHGHSHGGYEPKGLMQDVGIDARPQKDMKPFSLDDIREIMSKKKLHTTHHID